MKIESQATRVGALERAPLKVLIMAVQYPSAKHPDHGVYIEKRVRQLTATGYVEPRLAVSYDGSPSGLVGKAIKYLKIHLKAWGALFTPADIVQFHYPSGMHLLAAWPALVLRSRPIVATIHRGELYGANSRLERRLIGAFLQRRANAIITVSNDLRLKLVREFGVHGKMMATINSGSDMSRFRPSLPGEKDEARAKLELSQDRTRLLFVGSLTQRKGIDVLLEAVHRLAKLRELEVILIGGGPDRQELEDLTVRLGLEGIVRFLGPLPNVQVADWYKASDLFVFPSRSEGTPNVILESMASGTPIVASRVGGIPEVIQDGKNGLLFDSEDVDQLCGCIERLQSDPVLQYELACQALEDVGEHTIEKQIEKSIDVYRQVVANSSA